MKMSEGKWMGRKTKKTKPVENVQSPLFSWKEVQEEFYVLQCSGGQNFQIYMK